jgi:hypothetical protein
VFGLFGIGGFVTGGRQDRHTTDPKGVRGKVAADGAREFDGACLWFSASPLISSYSWRQSDYV